MKRAPMFHFTGTWKEHSYPTSRNGFPSGSLRLHEKNFPVSLHSRQPLKLKSLCLGGRLVENNRSY